MATSGLAWFDDGPAFGTYQGITRFPNGTTITYANTWYDTPHDLENHIWKGDQWIHKDLELDEGL